MVNAIRKAQPCVRPNMLNTSMGLAVSDRPLHAGTDEWKTPADLQGEAP
jgi:hypothetical protein